MRRRIYTFGLGEFRAGCMATPFDALSNLHLSFGAPGPRDGRVRFPLLDQVRRLRSPRLRGRSSVGPIISKTSDPTARHSRTAAYIAAKLRTTVAPPDRTRFRKMSPRTMTVDVPACHDGGDAAPMAVRNATTCRPTSSVAQIQQPMMDAPTRKCSVRRTTRCEQALRMCMLKTTPLRKAMVRTGSGGLLRHRWRWHLHSWAARQGRYSHSGSPRNAGCGPRPRTG